MSEYSTFINTGRGAQLSEGDLGDALCGYARRTALLDVITDEEDADENPLRLLPNCYITPHIAGAAGNETHMLADAMLDAFDCWREGKPSPTEITLPMLERMA